MADQCWDVKLLEVNGKVTPSGKASKHPASNRSPNSMRSHTQRHDPVTSAIRDRGRAPSGNIATEYRQLLLGQMVQRWPSPVLLRGTAFGRLRRPGCRRGELSGLHRAQAGRRERGRPHPSHPRQFSLRCNNGQASGQSPGMRTSWGMLGLPPGAVNAVKSGDVPKRFVLLFTHFLRSALNAEKGCVRCPKSTQLDQSQRAKWPFRKVSAVVCPKALD